MIDDYGETYNKEIFLVASDFAGAFEIFKRLKNDFPVSSVTITEEQEL
ncbi:MAG TPA: hypothetical protein PLG90_13405 [Ignavibacteria bacterium]|nr:hypothetical protein [Ignavibacteria bacterium]